MTRRIIYIKNPTQGSHFRILGGERRTRTPRTPNRGGPTNPPGGGSSGSVIQVTWVNPPQAAQNTDHRNPTPTHPPGMFNSVQGVQWVFSTKIGIASMSDWQQEFSEVHMPQFNLLSPLLGMNPTSWTQWVFEGTLFEDSFKKIDNSPYRAVAFGATNINSEKWNNP